MMRYRLKEAVRGEFSDPLLGRIEFDFAASRTTPQSEQDEATFAFLERSGFAVRASDKEASGPTEAVSETAADTEEEAM